MKNRILLLALPALLLSGNLHVAAAPPLINYQGRVIVGTTNFNSPPNGLFKFALVNTDGTASYWSNTSTVAIPTEPTAAISLPVTKGLYSVLLGDTTIPNMIAIPTIAFTAPDLRLRVWFSDGTNGFQQLTPDQRLAPTAYLADGVVNSANIADGSIISTKVAPGAINGAQIATNTLVATNFAVPAAPGAGQVLSYSGAGLTWAAAVFALNGTNAFYNGGNVGIGTNAPATKLEVRTGTGLYGLIHSDGTTKVGSYVGVNSSNVAGGWLGTQSNHPLYLYTNGGQPQMTIGTSGNVGIGTLALAHRLAVAGGPAWTSNSWQGAIQLPNASAIGWNQNAFGNSFGVGQSFSGFYIFHTLSAPGAVNAPAEYDFFINDVGDVGIGTLSPVAKLDVNGTIRTKTLRIVGGADIAEPFSMKETSLEEGSVVVIDGEQPGGLKRSTQAYDTRVAGIVSGANGVHPGIALQQEGLMDGGQNVALSGRVYVRAEAISGAIRPGDLLTTSDIPGHARKVTDHDRAQGAVLGKAMSTLDEGTGMVLVLVTLQ